MGDLVRLTERISAPMTGVKVDRDAGTIDGVLLCGFKSKNGRDYLPGSFGTGKQYEGRLAFVDHSNTPRKFGEHIGWYTNVRLRANGLPEATMHVVKSHDDANHLFEVAERNPDLVGLSHVAMCKTRMEGGREKVESVNEVESVDVVIGPATVSGLSRESTESKKVKLTELADRLAPQSKIHSNALRALAESVGDMDVSDAADGAMPDDAAKKAVLSGMHALLDQLEKGEIDTPTFKTKSAHLLKAHDKLSDKPDEAEKPDPKDEKADKAEKEAKQANDSLAALRECIATAAEQKLPASAVGTLEKVNAEARKDYAALLAKTEAAETVKSAGRQGAAKLDEAAKPKPDAAPAQPDGEGFARKIEAKK